ncbi:MAG: precorrin-6y C5,15-methyltransferase (decarboxylating) subunit CbiE [Planktomarina sp.]
MSDNPWITIVGLGEDGPEGLAPASRKAIEGADCVMGPPRHLALVAGLNANCIEWPTPFADGIQILQDLENSGQNVTVLASGDPFWYGAGAVIARHFGQGAWTCLPGPSTFSMAASHLGWPLEKTICLGLHAAPMARLRPYLAPGVRIIATMRDGTAVHDAAKYLNDLGFGQSQLTVLERLGGPNQNVTQYEAAKLEGTFQHPVALAIDAAGDGAALPQCSGLPDTFFETDGVMTKRPIRAMTLSALAPKPGEALWDIGGGSGSIAVEWLLSHASTQAICIEPRPDRLALIRANASALGVDRLNVVHGTAPGALDGLPKPDAVFVGGGLSKELLTYLQTHAKGARLVANAVTLEGEALLTQLHAQKGGDLMRVDLSHVAPMGSKRGWKVAYPIVQWSGIL